MKIQMLLADMVLEHLVKQDFDVGSFSWEMYRY